MKSSAVPSLEARKEIAIREILVLEESLHRIQHAPIDGDCFAIEGGRLMARFYLAQAHELGLSNAHIAVLHRAQIMGEAPESRAALHGFEMIEAHP